VSGRRARLAVFFLNILIGEISPKIEIQNSKGTNEVILEDFNSQK